MIDYLGPLTKEDEQLLKDHKDSALFKVVRKLCAAQYLRVCNKLSNVPLEDFTRAQGTLMGIELINNLLLHYSDQTNLSQDLQSKKKLRTLKEGEEV